MAVLDILGWIITVVALLVSFNAAIGFVIRYKRRQSKVSLLALIGCTGSSIANLINGLSRLIPITYVYCETKIGVVLFLSSTAWSSMFLMLHYCYKSRYLNENPKMWNKLQLLCITVAILTPIPFIIAGFYVDISEVTDGRCYFESDPWLVTFEAFLVVACNLLPALCFVRPLVKEWQDLTGATSSSIWDDLRILVTAIRGRYANQTQANRMSWMIESGRERIKSQQQAYSQSWQARLVRRTFHAVWLSTLGTVIVLVFLWFHEFGSKFENNFFAVDTAIGWTGAIVALPLPQEQKSGSVGTLDIRCENETLQKTDLAAFESISCTPSRKARLPAL